MAKTKSEIYIGCQGWNYDDWTTRADGEVVFYPRGTRSNKMLEAYSKMFGTVEVDSTFYAIPASSTVENWYKKTPENFIFSLKMPQQITHEYNLREPSFPISEEFCERVSILKEKLGVILIQLPPNFEASKENARAFREFMAELPKKIRFAVEFRNREWLVDWTFEELKKNSAALCLVEGGWIPREMMFEAIKKQMADFSYVRFMGERDLTSFDKILRPQDANLQMWKTEIERIKAKDVFVYFSNFYEGHAPESVNKLKGLFGQKTIEASSLENQKSLF
ncbi:MAG: DUF72 domain-containing protein [Pyrinomonadaceae bacterium]